MMDIFACNCLNVTITGEIDSGNSVEYVRHLIDSHSDQSRGDISHFLLNSRLVKVKDIKERYSCLCLKRIIADIEFTFCSVCGTETYALPLRRCGPTDLLLVSSYLNDENKIAMMMSNGKYSPTFGVILPRGAALHQISSDMADRGQATDFLPLSDMEMEVDKKLKQYLYQERQKMEDRIKEYISQENTLFEDLCQTAQEEKIDFLRMLEAIKQRHDLMGETDSFDKENNSVISVEKINYNQEKATKEGYYVAEEATMFEISADYIRNQSSVQSQQPRDISYSKQKTADFDGLFDMDDIDGDANGAGRLNKAEEAFDAEEVVTAEEAADTLDEVLPLTSSGINIMSTETSYRTRKIASSVIQNIPYNYQSKNRHVQTTPNSLPIKIPHIRSRMIDLDSEENQQTSESIADRIQKLARSVRNENEILDRPRRRLNTGELLKSRPILN